jgi:hypothetical protein
MESLSKRTIFIFTFSLLLNQFSEVIKTQECRVGIHKTTHEHLPINVIVGVPY